MNNRIIFFFSIRADFNFDFKQNQSDRPSNVCEDQPRYSNSFRNVSSFTSTANMNGSSANNTNAKPQRPTSMTSSVNQSAQFEAAANVLNNAGNDQNNANTQSSPTVTGSSSGASTPSLLKSSSQSTVDDGQNAFRPAPTQNGQRQSMSSTAATASTSLNNKPACAKIIKLSKIECCNDAGSGCECSDDELIAKFRERYGDQSLSPIEAEKPSENVASKTNSGSSSSSTKTGNISDTPLKDEASALESSDISSFEDLGAVGGMQINSIPSTSDTDKWQIINPTWNIDDTASTSSIVTDDKNESAHMSYTTNLPNSINELPQNNNASSENQRQDQTQEPDELNNESFRPQHSISDQCNLRSKLEKTLKSRQSHRKITRRQSDGIVYSASTSKSNHTSDRFLDDVDDDEDRSSTTSDEDTSCKRSQNSCRKCGKTKGDLKKYIARFRHQLETTTSFSESEIKLQLDAFLKFLEGHSAFDSKDEESMPNTEMEQSPSQFVAETIELEEFDDDDYDDEAGIHVYGSNDDTNSSAHPPRQFFNLSTVEKK